MRNKRINNVCVSYSPTKSHASRAFLHASCVFLHASRVSPALVLFFVSRPDFADKLFSHEFFISSAYSRTFYCCSNGLLFIFIYVFWISAGQRLVNISKSILKRLVLSIKSLRILRI